MKTMLIVTTLAQLGAAFALADSLPTPKVQAPNLLHLSRGIDSSSQIDISVGNPFHLQANPASKSNLIPTELTIDVPAEITIKSVTYPPASAFRLNQAAAPINVYQGDFGIAFALQANQLATAGKRLLHAKLRYQACDEKTCFRPSEIPFEFWVEIQ
jgi:thiol:disulfide interchange protein DsbD